MLLAQIDLVEDTWFEPLAMLGIFVLGIFALIVWAHIASWRREQRRADTIRWVGKQIDDEIAEKK